MSDKVICTISLIGTICSFILFIFAVAEGIRMYKNAYSKIAKADAKAAFLVAGAIAALCAVCILSTISFWVW